MTDSSATSLMHGADARIARGVVAGTAAGLLFLLANMWYADSQGMPAAAPLYDISTIFHFADKPQPSPDEIALLRYWIDRGATDTARVRDLVVPEGARRVLEHATPAPSARH